ncbi:MAG: hypothetical protein NTV04_07945 [Deltaproteobacteria bacterium]|nr:hypothetical protein [Deltaproteobacteria bacterium]
MPKTKLGKWAGALLAVFLVLFAALFLGINLLGIQRGTLLIRTVGICAMIAGIAAFITGAVSQIKFKDHSIVVISATVFGFIAILIIIMEVVEGIVWRSTH